MTTSQSAYDVSPEKRRVTICFTGSIEAETGIQVQYVYQK